MELQKLYIELEVSCQSLLQGVHQMCDESRIAAGEAPRRRKKNLNSLDTHKRIEAQLNVKEKFSDAIRILKKEFQSREKKGKLPTDATDILKYWWEKHFYWPYPTVSLL